MKFPSRSITQAICFCATTLSTGFQLQAGTVTNTNDSGTGSLRDAIAAATNGETIDFDPALNGAIITLTSGQLFIFGLQVTIDASALPAGIKISGNSNSRIFSITGNSNVTLHSIDIFDGYSLDNFGGGILALQSQLNLVNTTIRNCISTYDGGGLWANNVTGTLDRCSFLGNDSQSFGGGIFLIGNNSPTIKNTVVSGNRCPLGGGIATSSSPQIINCTIQGNSGPGIQLEGAAAPILRNTIVWGNRSDAVSIASQQILNGESSTSQADVNFCLVEGVASTLNNLDGTLPPANYPKFVNPTAPLDSNTPPSTSADLRVFINSQVLNVGDNSYFTPLDRDRAGKARVQDTTIDLGAFEGGYVTFGLLHPSLNPTEDSNGNGISNFVEYATGTDPSGQDNPAARPMISRSEGSNFLTTSQRSNAVDVVFSWETSTSLEILSWQEMVWGTHYTVEYTSNPSPGRQENKFKLLGNDPHRFYRQGFRSN